MKQKALDSKVVPLILTLVLTVVLAVALISCREKPGVSEKIVVAVSIPPQAEFVKAVGGDKIDILLMVPPGANPHIYEPKPSQMARLAESKMYVKVGSGLEFELAWMDKLTAVNRGMLVVDSAEGIELLGTYHRKGEEEKQRYGTDPHTWLSPRNAKVMVQSIYAALAQVDPANRSYYENNRDAYLQELDRLDQDIRNSLARVTKRTIIVYHPIFAYFARDYNLTEVPIEEAGKEPTAGMARIIEYARENNIKVIFTQPQFNPKNAEVIAREIGGRVVFVDDLARDYIENLRTILGELVKAMQ